MGKKKIYFLRPDSLKLLGFKGEEISRWVKWIGRMLKASESGFISRLEGQILNPSSSRDKCSLLSAWVDHFLQSPDSWWIYCGLCIQQGHMINEQKILLLCTSKFMTRIVSVLLGWGPNWSMYRIGIVVVQN
jgi:hypothetical protein